MSQYKSTLFRITLLPILALMLCALAQTQMVYDAITGGNYSNFTPYNKEQADKVRLTSIEHPITRVRFYARPSGTQRTITVAFYLPDPVTGLPGEELARIDHEYGPTVSHFLDIEIPPLQLTETEVWVSFLFTPWQDISPYVGIEPSVGTSRDFIAVKEPSGWIYWSYLGGMTNNYAMQIFMTPKE